MLVMPKFQGNWVSRDHGLHCPESVSIQLLGVFSAFEYTLDALSPSLWFLVCIALVKERYICTNYPCNSSHNHQNNKIATTMWS